MSWVICDIQQLDIWSLTALFTLCVFCLSPHRLLQATTLTKYWYHFLKLSRDTVIIKNVELGEPNIFSYLQASYDLTIIVKHLNPFWVCPDTLAPWHPGTLVPWYPRWKVKTEILFLLCGASATANCTFFRRIILSDYFRKQKKHHQTTPLALNRVQMCLVLSKCV